MENDIFLIHVQIGSFRMPLRIARKDEILYRKAEKLVVKYLDQCEAKYQQRPREEILTIVAFQLAVMVSKEQFSTDTVPLAEKIQALDNELAQLLSIEKQ